jgi:dolichol-phosphate mannosyltransferase
LADLTAKDDRVIAIEHSRNFGSQRAFMSGMQIARGDGVILLDGDLQDPPDLIPALFAKWKEGYDVVYARRARREGSPLLALAARAFYRVFRAVAYVPVPLDAGDFAIMNRAVVRELIALPETDLFLRGLRAWVGFKQTGIDYLRPKRPFGRSTHSWWANFWWAKKAIFSFSFAPLEALGYLAAALTMVSFLGVAYELATWVWRPEAHHALFTIIVVVAFFGSLNLLGVALVGEYVIRIFDETKRRPRFVRTAIRHAGVRFAAGPELEGFLRERAQAGSMER